jgi:hypothetical protein
MMKQSVVEARASEASTKGKTSYQWKEWSHAASTLDGSSSVVIGLITYRAFIEVSNMYHRHRLPRAEYHSSIFNAGVSSHKYEGRMYRHHILSYSSISILLLFWSILRLGERMVHRWNKKNKRDQVG